MNIKFWSLGPDGGQICFALPTCVFCGFSADNFALLWADKKWQALRWNMKALEEIGENTRSLRTALSYCKLATKSNTCSLPVSRLKVCKNYLMSEQIQTKVKNKGWIWNMIESVIFPSEMKWLAMTMCLIECNRKKSEMLLLKDVIFLWWSCFQNENMKSTKGNFPPLPNPDILL